MTAEEHTFFEGAMVGVLVGAGLMWLLLGLLAPCAG